MRIGVVGTGGMAEALGGGWAAAGHEVMFGGRSPARAKALAARVGGAARTGTPAEAAAFGAAVLLAVPYAAVLGVLADLGAADGALRGRVLIDCVNPVATTAFTLATDDGGPSLARRIADAAPGAHPVKAFTLCPADVWRAREGEAGGTSGESGHESGGGAPHVPLCGDSDDALGVVGGLVRDLGGTPVVAGGLERAGLVEATAAFAIGLYASGNDPRLVFAAPDAAPPPQAQPRTPVAG
ncbi:NAD(P)-binding domain-containing protein [Streptomonospora sp. S1-112]|uniref:NAD(P)-binding domain-containing protein n=1 Tax=Streptomonospora mangrovi TaxID=2883123 RepID=A0A9X3NQC4_9ACTN|nr:NAD(P)-binding domain-containing protein [Streptomonospora mangrovi]MDA0567949.1 NAD(P)-binding domain-containing protein [Streptomonospora mangrovi]